MKYIIHENSIHGECLIFRRIFFDLNVDSDIYCRPVIATWRSRDHYSFLLIVRVLLGQTIDDSFFVF